MVVLIAAPLTWVGSSAGQNEVRIYADTAFGDYYEVTSSQRVTLYFGWGACSEGLVRDFKDSISSQSVTLDGKPLFRNPAKADRYWRRIKTLEPGDEWWFPGMCAWPSERGGRITWEYRLGRLKPGKHTLTVYRELAFPVIDGVDSDEDGILDVYDKDTYFGPDPQTITIQVYDRRDVGSISGRLLDPEGSPLPGNWVDACEYDSEEWICKGGETDKHGFYRIQPLLPGDYRVCFWSEEWAEGCYDNTFIDLADRVSVVGGRETRRIDFNLIEAGHITGTVKEQILEDGLGDPLPGQWVTACPWYVADDDFGHNYSCTGAETDEGGFYDIGRLRPGDYRLVIWGPDWFTEWFDEADLYGEATPVTVTAGQVREDIDFSLIRAGQVSGTVTNEITGEPIPYEWVTACHWDVSDGEFGLALLCNGAETDENGFYLIESLYPGDYRLVIWEGEWEEEWYDDKTSYGGATPVLVSAGLVAENVDFELGRTEHLSMVLPYRESMYDRSEYVAAAHELGSLIADRIGYGVEVYVPDGDESDSIQGTIELFLTGNVELSLFGAFEYLMLREGVDAQAAVGDVRFGQPHFNGQFLTRYDDIDLVELSDLDGKHICWANPGSTSGYIVPSLMLEAASVTPSGTEFGGGHHAVVQTLYADPETECDAGATYLDARDWLFLQGYEDVNAVLKQLAVSPNIPNPNFIFGPEMPPEFDDQVVNALLDIAASAGGFDVLNVLLPGLEGLVEQDHSAYVDLADLIAAAGMTAQELGDTYSQ
jgi:phosphonate transport system substrate-binding protein